MTTTAIKRKTGDIGDVISGHASVSLDENSEIKIEGELILSKLIKMYKRVEERYKENKEMDRSILFNDFGDMVVSADDINKFSKTIDDYAAELGLDKNLIDTAICMLIKQSYNAGYNGFIATINNDNRNDFSYLKGTKTKLLEIKLEGNRFSLTRNSYINLEINARDTLLRFNELESSKVKVYSVHCYVEHYYGSFKNSLLEFYGDVLTAISGKINKNCTFIFHEDVINNDNFRSDRCTFVYYKSVIANEINCTNSILKTNNKNTLPRLIHETITRDKNNKSSNNKIYFINPDGTEKLAAYVNDNGKMVENR